MDPEAQLMAQALGGPPPSDVAQLQAQPGFPKDLSPAALAALFLVPGAQVEWKRDDLGRPYKAGETATTPGESGRYNIIQGDSPARGKNVGSAMLEYYPEKQQVHVGGVYARGPTLLDHPSKAAMFNEWAHSLGTKELRTLLRSVAETFPKAETITGDRISGAKYGAQQAALEKIKNSGGPGHGVTLPSSVQTVRLPRQPGFGAPPGQSLTDLW